jgi:HdeA/HdeB family protein
MNFCGKVVAAAALALTISSASRAQVIVDMSAVTCEQMLKGTANSIEVAIWLSGYYNGLRKNTKLDLNQLKKNADAVVQACAADRSGTVMKTIEKVVATRK